MAKSCSTLLKRLENDVYVEERPPSGAASSESSGLKHTGKVTVITFFSKLNKADLYNMTVLSKIHNGDLAGKVQCLGISRDKEAKDVPTTAEGKTVAERTKERVRA